MTLKAAEKCKHLSTIKGMEKERIDMFKKGNLLAMNLQYFAEGGEGGQAGGEGGTDNQTFDIKQLTDEQLQAIKAEFHFKDDNDVDEIIKNKHSRWQKELQEKEAEAARLAKMSAEEKLNEELKQAQEMLNQYKQKEARHEMATQVTKELNEAGIASTPQMVDMLVRDTAEETQKAIESYKQALAVLQADWEKKRNAGTPPLAPATKLSTKLTKDDVLKMSYSEHVNFKLQHPEEYKQIMGK